MKSMKNTEDKCVVVFPDGSEIEAKPCEIETQADMTIRAGEGEPQVWMTDENKRSISRLK